MNQELFDKVFGENVVTSEEEFKNKIKEALAEQFAPQSDFKFLTDTRDMLVERAGELNFADDLLKRWLLAANEKNTKEKIDEDFPQILQDLKYQLIKENLVKKNGLKVEELTSRTSLNVWLRLSSLNTACCLYRKMYLTTTLKTC